MTDEEIICTFMEEKPKSFALPADDSDVYEPSPSWWKRHFSSEAGSLIWVPLGLDLSYLRLVEGQLTEEQWHAYLRLLAGGNLLANVAPYRRVVHATATDKIAALAAVLRAGESRRKTG